MRLYGDVEVVDVVSQRSKIELVERVESFHGLYLIVAGLHISAVALLCQTLSGLRVVDLLCPFGSYGFALESEDVDVRQLVHPLVGFFEREKEIFGGFDQLLDPVIIRIRPCLGLDRVDVVEGVAVTGWQPVASLLQLPLKVIPNNCRCTFGGTWEWRWRD